MQSENPLIADLVKLANSAAGTFAGMTREARDGARERMKEAFGGLDSASREPGLLLDRPIGETCMSFTIYDASVPVFGSTLRNMRTWLDKAASEGDPAALVEARLVEDMKPLTAQYQFASDSAKNAIARLICIDPPAMPDTETTFAELQAR